MDKEVRCPWCENHTVPRTTVLDKGQGEIRERRCSECGKLLAAYLAKEGDLMRSVRKYDN